MISFKNIQNHFSFRSPSLMPKDQHDAQTIYDIDVEDNKGNKVSMGDYKGKVLLIVNTATHCGFTPQYSELQELYNKYKDSGFEILDFPCNQFMSQAPGNDEEIECSINARYDTTFQRFKKIDVNGDDASPLFKFLKEKQGGFMTDSIKWNFTKFLIDKEGSVVARYAPTTKPNKIGADIEKLLK